MYNDYYDDDYDFFGHEHYCDRYDDAHDDHSNGDEPHDHCPSNDYDFYEYDYSDDRRREESTIPASEYARAMYLAGAFGEDPEDLYWNMD